MLWFIYKYNFIWFLWKKWIDLSLDFFLLFHPNIMLWEQINRSINMIKVNCWRLTLIISRFSVISLIYIIDLYLFLYYVTILGLMNLIIIIWIFFVWMTTVILLFLWFFFSISMIIIIIVIVSTCLMMMIKNVTNFVESSRLNKILCHEC